MPATFKSISAIGFAVVLGACSQQSEPTRTIYSEPVYNKLGDVSGCRAADGTITDVSTNAAGSQRNPCLPPPPENGCENGYTSAGQPCREPEGGDQPTGRGQPGSPTTGQ